jgi:pyrimidine-nucleoside phosphorylase
MDEGWLRRALAAKRDGEPLDAPTWARIIEGYAAGTIDEVPIAALVMAAAIRGLDDDEIVALTEAMVRSGDVLAYPNIPGPVVDKHSSGGVGDTVSLIVVPLVAACGVPVAKLSGRALGHTGGTLDKLEAIPGVRTDLAPGAFVAQVERIGCAIGAQSDRLVPADRKLYALRDRTGTVASVGLIAASIVSKKIAGGADAIVFDVKAGHGAFMPTIDAASGLARTLVRLVARFGRRATAFVTDMEEPLGAAVDAREPRLAEATLAIAHELLRLGGIPEAEIAPRALDALASGAAYERFGQLVQAQGGSPAALDAIAAHPHRVTVGAARGGVVSAIDGVAIGEAARALVAADGPFAGIRIVARVGTPVRAGAVVAEIAGSSLEGDRLAAAFAIADVPPLPHPVIDAVLRDADAGASM